jgi:hypothetical protein
MYPYPSPKGGIVTIFAKRKVNIQYVRYVRHDMNNIYVGLSGVAGSGKDLFFSMLSEKIQCERLSIADALKEEVSEFTKSSYGIDPLNCTREEKNLIRPFLVFHGTMKRNKTNGRYWINQMNNKILKNNISNKIVIITDVRYDDYPKDEVYWLKKELGGYLVHISLYDDIPRLNSSIREYKLPANEEEGRNDPKLKTQADYLVDWKKAKGVVKPQLAPFIDGFITWLDGEEDRFSAYKKAEKGRL